jgi:predicted nucleic acid-binding protein
VIAVDSSVWVDFFNGAQSLERQTLHQLIRQAPAQVVVPDLVLYEVLCGFRDERQRRLASEAFEALACVSSLNPQSAERAAQRYRDLRSKGITIRSHSDVLLASYCIDHDLVLLQRDRDFQPFAQHFGLRLLQPLH